MDISLEERLLNLGYKGEFDLSSLIEACGDKFSSLERITSEDTEHWAKKYYSGIAFCADYRVEGIVQECGHGSVPEEAVANLWLNYTLKKQKKM